MLVFLVGNGIFKMYLKIMERKRSKDRKIVLFVRSEFKGIEKTIPKFLFGAEIGHEDFTF